METKVLLLRMHIGKFINKRYPSLNHLFTFRCLVLLYVAMMLLDGRSCLAVEPSSLNPAIHSEGGVEKSGLQKLDTATSDPLQQSGIIGITIDSLPASESAQDGTLYRVDHVFDGSPAKAVGLKAGDAILAIDSVPTPFLALPEVLAKLRGKPGTSVRIGIKRNEEVLDFTCARMDPSSSGQLSAEFKACLQHFEKYGFGMKSLARVCAYASSDSETKKDALPSLLFLQPRSRKAAEKYLVFPAVGTWTGPEVDHSFSRFVRSATAKDESTSSFHFINATHLFAQGSYSVCIKELDVCIQQDAAFAVAYRLRALAQSKLGNFVAAQQDWRQADIVIRPNSESSDVWLNGVTGELQRSWSRYAQSINSPRGIVSAIVTVERDGRISQVQITQSSGRKIVDNTVEQACLKAPLLDPPPTAMALPVRVQLTFELKVNGGGFYRQF